MQHAGKELINIVRKEAEIDLKARDPEGRPPTSNQIDKRFRELMVEEFTLHGLPVPPEYLKATAAKKRAS